MLVHGILCGSLAILVDSTHECVHSRHGMIGVRYTKAAGNVIDSILEQDLFGPTGLLPNQSQAQFEFKRTFTRGAIPSQDSVSADARIIPAEGGFFTYTPCTLQNVTPSYRQWMVQRLIQDIKSQPFFSVLEGALDPSLNLPSFQYSLPDRQTLDVVLSSLDSRF